MSSNKAEAFVLRQAKLMEEAGRKVEVIRETSETAEWVWVTSSSGRWFDEIVMLGAYRLHSTGRWNLAKANAFGGCLKRTKFFYTYSEQAMACRVYGGAPFAY